MISLYLEQPTWLHAVRASHKLLALALITLVMMPFADLLLWALALFATLSLYATLGRPAWAQLKSYRPMLWMFTILFFLQWWLASWQLGLLVVLRMSTLILLANAVTITSTLDDITEVFLWLMRPLRKLGIATENLAFAMSLCIRFIPILIAILNALLDAWRLRGGGKHYWRVIAPMVIQSLVFSQHVADAINARGGLPKQ
ncbi:energy-coupling factor transporter transmembrane component T family protein [Reinekea blandensis]|uniref:Putative ABC transporter, inner membrane subunit n=1 Tax=Reinekea blandensis MED297 TaxID=314283 RepID=A4BB10_9GAMM|nr:energy-coupling factor transporter transmembrane component T [Reinekea blandensis]EAR10623.1 Putative ABC transporter, inner membrane subunit [Reinekea sp. MED297] [Reinekea blandensis MED297]